MLVDHSQYQVEFLEGSKAMLATLVFGWATACLSPVHCFLQNQSTQKVASCVILNLKLSEYTKSNDTLDDLLNVTLQ